MFLTLGVIELGQKYQDGLVIVPRKNINNHPVPSLDFTSMYPNMIITIYISLKTKVSTTSSDLLLNTIFDNNQIIMKFKPYYDQEEKIELMPLMCKKLLKEHAKAKKLIKEHKNNSIKLAYFLSKSNVLKSYLGFNDQKQLSQSYLKLPDIIAQEKNNQL
ncbi:6756_t:CDS:2 [Dentiscutata heterogama]|uniref:6756_t:CDS:1 n=1 Tax=Dentiscutata heterogama TaxID=1316150 RepID=A0ACA9JWS5_9GLOM|nr:6756_t:CDS:2 [Dentiscutata heterogama]